MVRIGTPSDIWHYVKLDNDKYIYILGQNGFLPDYKNNKYVYYRKRFDLIKFMEKEGISYV